MGMTAGGAGGYGSLGLRANMNKLSQASAGNSKVMKAQSNDSLRALAQSQTQKFISNGKKVAQGASGGSRVSIKA